MIDNAKICEEIREIYFDIGECGIDIDVKYDETEKAHVIYLKKGQKTVKHFLNDQDIEDCMQGKQCVALGVEIAQLRDERYL